jgi:hypothetical protein
MDLIPYAWVNRCRGNFIEIQIKEREQLVHFRHPQQVWPIDFGMEQSPDLIHSL